MNLICFYIYFSFLKTPYLTKKNIYYLSQNSSEKSCMVNIIGILQAKKKKKMLAKNVKVNFAMHLTFYPTYQHAFQYNQLKICYLDSSQIKNSN